MSYILGIGLTKPGGGMGGGATPIGLPMCSDIGSMIPGSAILSGVFVPSPVGVATPGGACNIGTT